MRWFTLSLVAMLAVGQAATAGPFTTGNLVISRMGDPTVPLSTNAAAVFLDEFTTAGASAANTIALPTVSSGASKSLLIGPGSTSAGFLTLSTDQRYLTIGGTADVPVGFAGTFSTSLYPNRTIAFVHGAGGVDTTTSFPAAGTTPRSSVTSDGTSLWVASDTGSGTTGGLRYFTLGQTTAGVLLNSGLTNVRNVNIFNGQLYLSSSSGTTNNGVNTVSSGLPTTATTFTLLPTVGTSSEYDYFLANPTTLYVADDSATATDRGISKWTLSAGVWTKQWNVATGDSLGVRSLTGVVDASGAVNLYAISAETSTTASSLITITVPNKLVGLVDTGGAPPLSLTTLATAPANTIWRGVDFAPVPEPGAFLFGLAVSGIVGGITAYRRRQ